jgi:hypothetical protein
MGTYGSGTDEYGNWVGGDPPGSNYADIAAGFTAAGHSDQRAVSTGWDVFKAQPAAAAPAATPSASALLVKAVDYEAIRDQVSDPGTRRVYDDAARDARDQAAAIRRREAAAWNLVARKAAPAARPARAGGLAKSTAAAASPLINSRIILKGLGGGRA